jgi:hypothetical protein
MTADIREKVTQRAFEIWEQAGRPEGQDLDHWLMAEAELTAPPKKAAAPRKAAAEKKPVKAKAPVKAKVKA